VPDSCFRPWVNYLSDTRPGDHIISTNEGEAVSIAAGYNLSTGRTAGVYLQNSGLGNLVNPLSSVLDRHVYSIPVFLMISMRGRPGAKDEPQHKTMGKTTTKLLDDFDITYERFSENRLANTIPNNAIKALRKGRAYALLMRKGDIESYPEKTSSTPPGPRPSLTRWDAITAIASSFGKEAIFFATTGKTGRELYYQRDKTDGDHSLDFLNVGGMGWVSSLAFGFSIGYKKRIVILDGDGSILMHMGNLATIGHYKPSNVIHFILDNRSYDSVGGLGTVSETVDFGKIAEAAGYRRSIIISDRSQLVTELTRLREEEGPILVTILVEKGSIQELPRPSLSPQARKVLLLGRIGLN
jgi:phosphonopyruvate decarboxylase